MAKPEDTPDLAQATGPASADTAADTPPSQESVAATPSTQEAVTARAQPSGQARATNLDKLVDKLSKPFVADSVLRTFGPADINWSDEEQEVYQDLQEYFNDNLRQSIDIMLKEHLNEKFPTGDFSEQQEYLLPDTVQDAISLKLMVILVGAFSPGIKDHRLGVLDQMPASHRYATDNLLEALLHPSKFVQAKGNYRTTNNQLASDMLRMIIMQEINKRKLSLQHWNVVFPNPKLAGPPAAFPSQDMQHFSKHIDDMQNILEKRLVLSANATRSSSLMHSVSRQSSLYAAMSASIFSTHIGVAVAGGSHTVATIATAAVSLTSVAAIGFFTAGIAVLALAAVAAVAYAYYHYSHKTHKAELDNLLETEKAIYRPRANTHNAFDHFSSMSKALSTDSKIAYRKIQDPLTRLKKKPKGSKGLDVQTFAHDLYKSVMDKVMQ